MQKQVLRAALVLMCAIWASPAGAQGAPGRPSLQDSAGVQLPFAYDGPPPPTLPATIARDGDGRTTVRAIKLATPLRIDGLLDEMLYTSAEPVSGLIQTEPQNGAPATERTEIWISFDEDNVYFSAHVFESQPDRLVANEMRRDGNQVFENDHIVIAFDTFYDRRNSMNFALTPIGGRSDGQLSNEAQWNGDWNPVWDFATRRTEDGWTAEAAIPFKSLRYRPGRAQIWGMQVRRTNRWKNEITLLTDVPQGLGRQAIFRVSRFATLVGLEAPPGARALDVKPYVTSGLSTDLSATPSIRNDLDKDFGVDVKYGVTRGLTADLTYNTDFAQVEADEQQVNLTRFSLFFPEKRDFFLENRGIFDFGGVAGNTAGDTPLLFYSRRIGLERGQAIPIDAGGRLTGRVGRYSVGLIDMQADSADAIGVPSTNFLVARVRRDILRRSAIGLIATRRSSITSTPSTTPGSGETYGVDGTFAFFTNLTINAYWAATTAEAQRSDNASYRANLNYNADRYGLQLEHMLVGDNFSPEIGFVRRGDFRKNRAQLRFSPRPRNSRFVRKYWFQASGEYFENHAGVKETRELLGEFYVDFHSSDRVEVTYQDNFELIPEAFRIARGVTVPAGPYALRTLRGQFTFGQQRPASGTVFVENGPFYGGDRTAVGVSTVRVKFSARVAVEPGFSINRVTLPFGNFTTKLVSSRVTYTLTPMMFVSSLVQYNSSNSTFSTNVRLRWEYRPGSELFVVYNEGRDTLGGGAPELQTRSFVIKANRLLRF